VDLHLEVYEPHDRLSGVQIGVMEASPKTGFPVNLGPLPNHLLKIKKLLQNRLFRRRKPTRAALGEDKYISYINFKNEDKLTKNGVILTRK